ncbi:hypothetical protein CES85_2788 (plasmid) [Ochrobactrum quorumnocens]|uniref:Uncharacterized protein n=1 Tax=Ochrobactrum quorumnocens TaxID=271865 RepID=A0A248UNF2_9HYPH|nr:hypothetical protein CES85_2788 [[Ochrobactrum] quorumnocens]
MLEHDGEAEREGAGTLLRMRSASTRFVTKARKRVSIYERQIWKTFISFVRQLFPM